MKNILISACLYGEKCRYDGRDNLAERLCELEKLCRLIPVCPEVSGGLETPRSPAEIVGSRVVTSGGRDVTEEYEKGARATLDTALKCGCTIALMKAKSPSCGSGKIYDGSFSKTLTDGNGITVRLLLQNGIRVFDETQIDSLILLLSEENE